MNRIPEIEGLRAYLAIWVLFVHVLGESGYATGAGLLSRVANSGQYAVDIFIIISGFVIFFLLDAKREAYLPFVTRRFFRLFPAFIVLFMLGIPLSWLAEYNAAQNPHVSSSIAKYAMWRGDAAWHVPLHLTMLHGVVPESWLPNAPTAFLPPAWSISLEWQFYLLALPAFTLAVSHGRGGRILLAGTCIALFFLAPHLPYVQNGAFLPFHVEFFFFGGTGYFVWKRLHTHPARPDALLAPAILCGAALFLLGQRAGGLIPVCFWLAFFALICEPAGSVAKRVLSPLFHNRAIQYLGKISYSIYLSHIAVAITAEYLLLRADLGLGKPQQFAAVLACTLVFTLLASGLLFRWVEQPGMRWGRKWTARFSRPGSNP